MSEFEKETFDIRSALGAGTEDTLFECKKVMRVCGVRGESLADFILPDYMGDVKKLLRSSANVGMANKFVGEGEVSFLTPISYRITYVDSEDRLTEAAFTSDYEYSTKTADGFADAAICTRVQGLSVRLQGPRKICAKANLVTDITMSVGDSISDIRDIPDAEKKMKRIKIHGAEFIRFDERDLTEEVGRIEGVGADEAEVVKCDASAYIENCQRTGDDITASGNIDAFCLVRVGEDVIRLERRIPFDISAPCDSQSKFQKPFCELCVSSVSVNLNTSVGEGNDAGTFYTSAVMNMRVEGGASLDFNEEYPIICDAFAKGKANECGYKTFSYDELVIAVSEKRRVTVSDKRVDSQIRSILDCDVKLCNIKYSVCGSELLVSCGAEYSIIAGGMEMGECFVIKGEREIEERFKIFDDPSPSGELKLNICAFAAEPSASFDGENVYMAFTLCVGGCICEEKSERVLTSLRSEEAPDSSRRVIVYYPCAKDTLWSVAKRYAVPISEIERYNPEAAISADDAERCIHNVDKLIIVMK